jgi:hypothetical protein
MEDRAEFLKRCALLHAAVDRILSFYRRQPELLDLLDWASRVQAILTLCREHRRDCKGVADIEHVKTVFERFGKQVGSANSAEITSALASADRATRWLGSTFPEAKASLKSN